MNVELICCCGHCTWMYITRATQATGCSFSKYVVSTHTHTHTYLLLFIFILTLYMYRTLQSSIVFISRHFQFVGKCLLVLFGSFDASAWNRNFIWNEDISYFALQFDIKKLRCLVKKSSTSPVWECVCVYVCRCCCCCCRRVLLLQDMYVQIPFVYCKSSRFHILARLKRIYRLWQFFRFERKSIFFLNQRPPEISGTNIFHCALCRYALIHSLSVCMDYKNDENVVTCFDKKNI